MKKKKKIIMISIILFTVLALILGALCAYKNEDNDSFLDKKLEELDEVVVEKYEYKGSKKFENQIKVPIVNAKVPFTTKKIEINYVGTVLVGYKVPEIKVDEKKVDNKKIITIKLPKPYIAHHFIDEGNCEYYIDNCLFNPIDTNDFKECFRKIKKEELSKAEKEGLYDKAEKQAQKVLSELYEDFKEYDEIEFI